MKSISVTVGILILTVFLSLSAPAYAGTTNSYTLYGYADYPNNDTPADGESVTIFKEGDPSNNITAKVGSSFGASGYWKCDLYNMPESVINGDTIVINVLGKSTSVVVDTSTGGQPVSNLADNGDDDNDDSGSGGNSGGNSGGTYPPGWGATPTATSAPADDAKTTPTPELTEESAVVPITAPMDTSTDEAPAEAPSTKMQTKSTPGFGAGLAVLAIAGLLVATYLVMRRRE